MSKYLLSAAAAALVAFSFGPAYASHSCPGGFTASHEVENDSQIISQDPISYQTQGYSPQGEVHSPEGQGTSGYSGTETTTQAFTRTNSLCRQNINTNVIHPDSTYGTWTAVGDPVTTTVIDDIYGPGGSDPSAHYNFD
jgi:hypothetical protein